MIKNIEIRIDVDGEKTFKGKDLDAIISEIDSYLVSKK